MMQKNTGFVVELGVSDVQQAIDFYVRCLGCGHVEIAANNSGRVVWGEISFEQSRIMFEEASLLADELPGITPEVCKPRSALVLRVGNVQSAKLILEKLRERGHVIDSGPSETEYGTFEFSFRDLDEYVIVIAGKD